MGHHWADDTLQCSLPHLHCNMSSGCVSELCSGVSPMSHTDKYSHETIQCKVFYCSSHSTSQVKRPSQNNQKIICLKFSDSDLIWRGTPVIIQPLCGSLSAIIWSFSWRQGNWWKLVKVSALYQQYISYLIIITIKLPIILGFSWMHLHDTQISWFNKGSTRWSCHCMNHCLHIPHLLMTSTIVESPEIQQTFPQDIVNSKKISIKIKPKLWATTVPHIWLCHRAHTGNHLTS